MVKPLTHCPSGGHRYGPGNSSVRVDSEGYTRRTCLECKRVRERRYYHAIMDEARARGSW